MANFGKILIIGADAVKFQTFINGQNIIVLLVIAVMNLDLI